MKTIGLLYHPQIHEAQDAAAQVGIRLKGLGARVWTASAWDEAELLRRAEDSGLLIAFGGDGTIVRVARVLAGHQIPLLGVNFGRVGFLAELQPSEVDDRLEELLDGQYWLEERLMLHAELRRERKEIQSFEAFNDVVVSRGCVARVVHIDAHVDGQHLTTYVADGVIVATPSGSTAYSLAAGGPVVDPQMSAIILKPIAPHLTVASALVLDAKSQVHLALSSQYEAMLTVDGQVDVALQDGDLVVVTASPHKALLARMGPRSYFYQTLLQKLSRK